MGGKVWRINWCDGCHAYKKLKIFYQRWQCDILLIKITVNCRSALLPLRVAGFMRLYNLPVFYRCWQPFTTFFIRLSNEPDYGKTGTNVSMNGPLNEAKGDVQKKHQHVAGVFLYLGVIVFRLNHNAHILSTGNRIKQFVLSTKFLHRAAGLLYLFF